MSFFKKLFGGRAEPETPKETYMGYSITATPVSEGGAYRIGALIEKETDGQVLSHSLVRADTIQGLEAAQEASIAKAKQVIDQQGDRVFNA